MGRRSSAAVNSGTSEEDEEQGRCSFRMKRSKSSSTKLKKKYTSSLFRQVFTPLFRLIPGRADEGASGKRVVARMALICLVMTLVFAWSHGSFRVVQAEPNATLAEATKQVEESQASGDDVDFVPEQQAFKPKAGVKLDKKTERDLACKQLECESACNRKIKPQCSAKKSCLVDRQKLCKRRCFKARCEARCKDEPHYGYVEREQKMDKCKEGCTGTNTAAHNKCIKKCHSEFKPCKSRCHEAVSRYVCENPAILELKNAAEPTSTENKKAEKSPLADAAAAADDDEVI